MDALVNGFQALLFFGERKFLCVLASELSIEFFGPKYQQAISAAVSMYLITYRNNFPRGPRDISVL